MIKYSHVIWDFNGTIINDVETGIRSVNTLLQRRGMKTISGISDYHDVFTFPVIEYYRKLGFDFDAEKYDDIAVEWVAEYHKNREYSYVNQGIINVIIELHKREISQTVLSASEIGMLTAQLSEIGITGYFDEILGLDNIKAGSKINIANDWLRRVKPKAGVFIGDTVHDYETAVNLGIDCILLTGGHQNKDTLLKCGVPVLDNISEIFTYLI